MNTRTNATAFTLIELLTVIAIIGILAAIIIPTVGKVRETAKSAQCTSNLRQVVHAAFLWGQDHNDQIPPRNRDGYGDWAYWPCWLIEGQGNLGAKSVLVCPVLFNNGMSENYKRTDMAGKVYRYSYSANGAFSGNWDSATSTSPARGKVWRFSDLQEPSRTHLYTELGSGGDSTSHGYFSLTRTDHCYFLFAHNGRQNFACADAHVSALKREDIPTETNDPPKHVFWTGGTEN
ncbi:MAG: prepilin-type N-terminal cleavage/methylation domain-containing protein [Opitutaceae bacterium]|jgi:general secretion pathway protein G|nr:prepilin-type N-terminal cleavage/methylation domain-containing protein [Opitutaceae bacterium]